MHKTRLVSDVFLRTNTFSMGSTLKCLEILLDIAFPKTIFSTHKTI